MPNYVSRDAACCECRAAPAWRAYGWLYCEAHLPAAVKEAADRVEYGPPAGKATEPACCSNCPDCLPDGKHKYYSNSFCACDCHAITAPSEPEPEPALTAEEKKAADRRELYAYVWAAMDACNSSGLIYSFPKIIERIAEAEGIRGACVNDHPIVIIMADKLLQLAGCSLWTGRHDGISKAYQKVLAVVEPRKE